MAFVQEVAAAVSTGTPRSIAISVPSVASGNSLLVWVVNNSSAIVTVSASSNLDGAFTSAIDYNPDRLAKILYKHNCTAGTHTVTASIPSGTVNFYAGVVEVSGLAVGGAPLTGSFVGASGTTHYCADTPGIDTTGPAFFLGCGGLNGTATTSVAGTSPAYTKLTSAQTFIFGQYHDAPSAVTGERGQWTHTGSARFATSVLVAFPYASESDPSSYVTGGWFGR